MATYEERKVRDDRNVTELGQKMLQGWTLLAEACPNEGCNVPLLEKKGVNCIYCVNCKTKFKRQYLTPQEFSFVPVESTPSDPNNSSTSISSSNIPSSNKELPVSANIPSSNKELPTSSSIPSSNKEQLTEFTILPTNEESSPRPSLRTLETTNEEEERKQKRQKVSDKIGQKLLQGWVLLQESCPSCHVPLMRNREDKMFCLSCDLEVIKSKDFDPKRHKSVSDLKKVDLTEHITTKPLELQQDTKPSTVNTFPANQKPTEYTSFNKIDEDEFSLSNHTVVDNALQALYSKLNQCEEWLDSSGSNIQQSISLCVLIRECADAIHALQRIDHKL